MRRALSILAVAVALTTGTADAGDRYGWGGGRGSGYYPGGYWSGHYENGTARYHYSHPRVTTGFGFRQPRYGRYYNDGYRYGRRRVLPRYGYRW